MYDSSQAIDFCVWLLFVRVCGRTTEPRVELSQAILKRSFLGASELTGDVQTYTLQRYVRSVRALLAPFQRGTEMNYLLGHRKGESYEDVVKAHHPKLIRAVLNWKAVFIPLESGMRYYHIMALLGWCLGEWSEMIELLKYCHVSRLLCNKANVNVP